MKILVCSPLGAVKLLAGSWILRPPDPTCSQRYTWRRVGIFLVKSLRRCAVAARTAIFLDFGQVGSQNSLGGTRSRRGCFLHVFCVIFHEVVKTLWEELHVSNSGVRNPTCQ